MFFLRKGSLIDSGIFTGFTDYHSHILYGVDDGIRTLEDSLATLRYYEALGIQHVWLTPHIMEDIPNTTETLRNRFAELQQAYSGPILLNLAAEYMMDSLLDERLMANDLLPIGTQGNHLLIETSYYNPPAGLYKTLELVMSKGYYPLLAHPERYRYMEEKDYDRLRQMGVKFQLNLPALVGMYSSNSQNAAYKLLQKGYYQVGGTDVHSLRSIQRALQEKDVKKKVFSPLQQLKTSL
ncbi:MAG: capsular biosynthesis protein [Bacteroidales bacterium]|nr:capsular biosynthesis protein [Bacteroidales bacterium]